MSNLDITKFTYPTDKEYAAELQVEDILLNHGVCTSPELSQYFALIQSNIMTFERLYTNSYIEV